MDKNYLYYNKINGNNIHIESQGFNGINNYKLIAENIYTIYKTQNDKKMHLVLELVKSYNSKSSLYKFTKTTEKNWPTLYSKNHIVGYFKIEPYQENYIVGGRVKSDSNYCCLNKLIANNKVLF